MKKQSCWLGMILILLMAAGCQSAPEATPEPTVCPEVPECPECPEQQPCPGPAGGEVPFEEAWLGSVHADSGAEAFRHWDEDDPAVVSPACAKCHSTAGYVDYHGGDGTEAGSIENEIPAREVEGVQCAACHNPAVVGKDRVVMPSGLEIADLGSEARCMACHQGRESKINLEQSILAAAGVEELGEVALDEVNEELRFTNIHYYAAAASKYGTLAKGGYEYPGKSYDGNFAHVDSFDTCIECHDPHSLQLQADQCTACHGEGEPSTYRSEGSLVDYDGDGDLEEGAASEIAGLEEVLYQALQDYASETTGSALVYDAQAYPYFFIDTNGDGEISEEEANYGNQFASWTPRLLQAAYNYQVSRKDPGAYAHGGKYIIQLLYDSIEDLNPALVVGLNRNDHGHFAGSEEAFRHWDEDGEVPGACSRCHSADGLPLYLTEGAEIAQPIANGFQCDTCHGGDEWPARYTVSSVTFPSGAAVRVSSSDESGLCMTCHQGRSSTVSVQQAVEGLGDNEVSADLGFINIHYFAAGASRYGSEVKGGYEFEGREYLGYFEHVEDFQTCTDCHDAHQLEVITDQCFTCHGGADAVEEIRMTKIDFDGDGDLEEGLAAEIDTLSAALYDAMQTYAENVVGTGILYDSHAYPYFFNDQDGDGEVGPGEAIYPNQYTSWTPALLKASYNYQYAQKDPGGFAHNGGYIIQLLIDSIDALGGNVSSYTRP